MALPCPVQNRIFTRVDNGQELDYNQAREFLFNNPNFITSEKTTEIGERPEVRKPDQETAEAGQERGISQGDSGQRGAQEVRQGEVSEVGGKGAEVTNPALANVESTAKALEGSKLENLVEITKSSDGRIMWATYLYKGLRGDTISNGYVSTDGGNTWRSDTGGYEDIPVSSFKSNNPKAHIISEAYHKAKADGIENDLTKAVEELLGKKAPKPKEATQEEIDATAKKAGVSPKNLRDLYNINRDLFGLNRVKALASAIAMDRMVGAMAKRAGVTKAEMYGKLKFEKGNYELISKTPNAVFQGVFDGKPASFITLPEGISIVDGWYSPIEKRLRETKIEKQSANKWLTGGFIGKGDEAIYTGVKGWLESKNPQEQVSKKEILDWMKDNRVEIVEVVKGGRASTSYEDANNYIQENPPQGEPTVGDELTTWDNYTIEKNRKGSYNLYDRSNSTLPIAKDLTRDEALNLLNQSFKFSPTKFSQYQLEGDKSNYKEVLVTLPRKKTPPDSNVTIKTREEQLSDRSNYTAVEDGGYFVITGLRGAKKSIKKDYFTPTKEIAIEQYIEEQLSYERGDAFDIFDKGGNYIETVLAPNKDRAKEIYIGRNTVEEKTKFKSSHFDEPNILVHLRMNTRTDADGNKVLFLEEIQSDWGQKGKKEGFKPSNIEELNKERNEIVKKYEKQFGTQNSVEFYKALGQDKRYNEISEILSKPSIPTAPFVTDTNAWTKLGLKMAMREAVAQGVDKIAWTTGEQQFDRWGTEKIDWVRGLKTQKVGNVEINVPVVKENTVYKKEYGNYVVETKHRTETGIDTKRKFFNTKEEAQEYANNQSKGWTINIQEQFRGTAFEGMNVDEKALSESGVTINSKEDLKAAIDRNLSREKTETERQKLTDRIWDRMQKEGSGTSLPRKEGMEAFYDRQVRDVAKALVKELTGKEGVVGETKILEGEGIMGEPTIEELAKAKELALKDNDKSSANFLQQQIDRINKGQEYSYALFNPNEPASEYFDKVRQPSVYTQQSIDITPELKAQVQKGMPLFQRSQTGAKGAMQAMADGTFVIYAITDPNVSTPLHELAHVFEHYLTDAEKAAVQSWAKTKGWTTETSEAFARGFEKYLAEGKAPTPVLQKVFEKFKQWLTEIYNGITGSEIDVELNDAMREIYAQMLGADVVNKPTPQSEIEATAKALEGVKFNANFNLPLEQTQNARQVAEAYHKAKTDGSNPELVKAVEELLGKQAAPAAEPTTEPAPATTTTAPTPAPTPPAAPKSELEALADQMAQEFERIAEPQTKAEKKQQEQVQEIAEEDDIDMPSESEMKNKREQIEKDFTSALENVKKTFGDLFNQNLGVIYDPRREAQKIYNFHVALVNLARNAIRLGVSDVNAFAASIGRRADKFLERAWKDAELAEAGSPMIYNSADDMLNTEYQRVAEAYEKQYADAEKRDKSWARSVLDKLGEAWFDANYVAKRMLRSAGAVQAIIDKNLLNGAASKAQKQFSKFSKDIFGGLSKAENKLLNNIIQSRTIISIDTRFDATGKKRIKHPGDTTKESHEIYLGQLEQDNPELFNKLMDRADKYFEAQRTLLKERLDEGRISIDSYNAMINNEYSPRVFLEFLLDDADSEMVRSLKKGVKNMDISSLSDGDVNSLFHNAQWLLSTNVLSTSRVIFHNRANRSLYEFATANPTNGFIVVQNPVGVNNQTGQPIYPNPKSGYQQIQFFENGVRKSMLATNEFANSWTNNSPAMAPNYANAIRLGTGGAIKRMLVTGINPAFAVANLPRDIVHSLYFTKTYSPFLPIAITQISADLFRTAKDAWTINSANKTSSRYNQYLMEGGGMDFLSVQGKPFVKRALIQSKFDNGIDALTNTLGYINNRSEIWVRLAVRDRNIAKQTAAFAKKNGRMPNTKELERIKANATEAARSTMDFSKGGKWAKFLDNFIPYLNAGLQGVYVSATYVKNNPGVFALKAVQAIALAAALAAYNMEEYDEDYQKIDEGEKARNFIFMLPYTKKSRDGRTQRAYIRIPKAQSAEPIFALGEIYGKIIMNKPLSYSDIKLLEKSLEGITPNLDPRSVPIIDALNTYYSNYDRFLEKKIWRGAEGIEPAAEYYEGRTPWLWRDIGESLGASPERLKEAVGKATSDPDNNIFYVSIAEGYESLIKGLPEEERTQVNDMALSTLEKVLTPIERKFLAYTIDKKDDTIENMERQLLTANKLRNDQIKTFIRNYIKKDNEAKTEGEKYDAMQKVRSEFNQWVKTQKLKKDDEKEIKAKFESGIKMKDADNVFYKISNIKLAEVKAFYFYSQWVEENKKGKGADFVKRAKQFKVVPQDEENSDFWDEFKRLQKQNR